MQAGVPDMQTHPLSGPAVHVKHVVEELKNLGHEVRVIANINNQICRSDDLIHFIPVGSTILDRPPLRFFERIIRRIQSQFQLPYADLFESLRFMLSCRRELAGYDLFYERMGWFGYAGALAARQMGIPLILEVNGDHLDELESLGIAPQGLQRRLSIALMNLAARWSSHVVATGYGWQRRFLQRWDVLPEKVSVIENGSEMVELLRRDQLRAFSKQTDTSVPILAYIGGFEPWHGLDILLQAFAKTQKAGINAQLYLIGDGSGLGRLNRLIDELGLSDSVHMTGHLPVHQVADYLMRSDIGLSPYCGRENFTGLKLLDYKAAGLATIASGKNGEPAILKHKQTAWIVPPCDADALANVIIMLCKDVTLCRQLGQAARIEAETSHSWRHTAGELEKLFVQVLANRPTSEQFTSDSDTVQHT